MRHALPAGGLALAFAFAIAGPARAGDEPADPASLLRQAKTAETVDHDVAKAMEIYRRVVDSVGDNVGGMEYQIEQALIPVGADALPTLERVMRGDRPDRARFAAKMYAKTGKVAAIPGLERTVREGDGFARSAALEALLWN